MVILVVDAKAQLKRSQGRRRRRSDKSLYGDYALFSATKKRTQREQTDRETCGTSLRSNMGSQIESWSLSGWGHRRRLGSSMQRSVGRRFGRRSRSGARTTRRRRIQLWGPTRGRRVQLGCSPNRQAVAPLSRSRRTWPIRGPTAQPTPTRIPSRRLPLSVGSTMATAMRNKGNQVHTPNRVDTPNQALREGGEHQSAWASCRCDDTLGAASPWQI